MAKVKPKKKRIIAGTTFGDLTVLKKFRKMAVCICICGNEALVNNEYLLNGFITSCNKDDNEDLLWPE